MSKWILGVQHRTGARVGLIATLTLAVAASAGAQQVDSLPFRAGQWAAEFTAANFSGVGALRFTSPRSAWLIDVQGRYTRQSGDSDSPTRFEVVTNANTSQLRLGWRRYGLVAPRVVRHLGVGVIGRYGSSEQSPGAFDISGPFSFDQSRSDFSAGLFAEVGAQWLITPNFGLGASWSADVQAGSAHIERITARAGSIELDRSNTKVNTLSAAFGIFGVRATVYF